MAAPTSVKKERSAFLNKGEKEKLAAKIGFREHEELSKEMDKLRMHFSVMRIPHIDLKDTRKIFDDKIGHLTDELVLMRNEDREEE